MTSFWRNNDVIITSCVQGGGGPDVWLNDCFKECRDMSILYALWMFDVTFLLRDLPQAAESQWVSLGLGSVQFRNCIMTSSNGDIFRVTGGCFTNVSRALQNNLAKIYDASNHIYGENFKLKLCMCAQSMALGTRTKFQLEMLIGSAISATHKFRDNILESSRNVSETTHWPLTDQRWIPLTKASDAELWCFLRSSPELTTE